MGGVIELFGSLLANRGKRRCFWSMFASAILFLFTRWLERQKEKVLAVVPQSRKRTKSHNDNNNNNAHRPKHTQTNTNKTNSCQSKHTNTNAENHEAQHYIHTINHDSVDTSTLSVATRRLGSPGGIAAQHGSGICPQHGL